MESQKLWRQDGWKWKWPIISGAFCERDISGDLEEDGKDAFDRRNGEMLVRWESKSRKIGQDSDCGSRGCSSRFIHFVRF